MGDSQHLANFLLFGYQIQEVYPLILPKDDKTGFIVEIWLLNFCTYRHLDILMFQSSWCLDNMYNGVWYMSLNIQGGSFAIILSKNLLKIFWKAFSVTM